MNQGTNHVWRGLALALSLPVLSVACARSAPASQNPPGIDGVALFSQACAKCHGADGSGGLPMVANGPKPIDLREPAWQRQRTDADIATAIREGRGAMPPFAGVLSAAQIDALRQHVRSLKKP
jgi:mono/diheme cytochrome c family protein